jgi:crotonobetainyl-CoA:carnitine CoA-transferase CaiB-like acyl-CoA transferase
MQPLAGLCVLDFTTLLPGPLATLILAEAGAEVIKIERPGRGDEMRSYEPKFGADSINFALLNRGKKSVAIDLKQAGAINRLRVLLERADVIVEQFRPGVMERFGIGYDALKSTNPRLIYCSITGYGSDGRRTQTAGHDLNYAAESGMLSLIEHDGVPALPPVLIADIGGGAYPAVMNILLALQQRERTGVGCRLDVAMSENLFTWMYWAIGNGVAAGEWPRPNGELVTGGSPRYHVYRTADGRFLAAAPIEEKFWDTFCELIGLAPDLRNDQRDREATRSAVARIIASRTSNEWRDCFAGKDVCCSIVATLKEALADPHFHERGLFSRVLEDGRRRVPALPVPVVPCFRSESLAAGYPALGDANAILNH